MPVGLKSKKSTLVHYGVLDLAAAPSCTGGAVFGALLIFSSYRASLEHHRRSKKPIRKFRTLLYGGFWPTPPASSPRLLCTYAPPMFQTFLRPWVPRSDGESRQLQVEKEKAQWL